MTTDGAGGARGSMYSSPSRVLGFRKTTAMSNDDWDDLSPEDEEEAFDEPEDMEPEDAEPERSGATEDDEYPMTFLKAAPGLAMTAWLGWTGYQHGQLYGSIDRSHPQELRVAYVRTER